MKRAPGDEAQYKNLQPSRFAAEGFLGDDTRTVEEIVAADAATLARSGVSAAQLLAALRAAWYQGRAGLGSPVDLGRGRSAVYHESMGRIPSPFHGEGVFEKGEVVLSDRRSGTSVVLTALGIHLIERHGFFQGIGSHYRIDPATAVALLLPIDA